MGHRTLIAYERGGSYDVHCAHWGVDPEELTSESPFGGPPDDGWARERAGDILDPKGGDLADGRETAVDPEPIARGIDFETALGRIDSLEHEALYAVDGEWNVRTYLVFAIRWENEPRTAVIRYEGKDDAAYLRGWLAGTRAVRETNDVGSDAVVRALRWLDPDRGTVVWPAGERDA